MNPYKHKHWHFVAFDEWVTEDREAKATAEVTVNDAENEEEALGEAKKMLVRKFFILKKVWECTQCFYADRQAQALEKMIKSQHE